MCSVNRVLICWLVPVQYFCYSSEKLQQCLTGERNSEASNIRDNGQVSQVATKYKTAIASFIVHYFQILMRNKV